MEVTSTICPSADTHKAGTYCNECGAYTIPTSFRQSIVTKNAEDDTQPEADK